MEANPIQNDARKARRRRLLGPDAACVRCGLTNQECLVPTKRSLVEAHHVAGHAHDDALVVPLCRNCHALMTEVQLDAGVDFRPQPTLLHRIIAGFTSLGVFLIELGTSICEQMRQLELFVGDLDTYLPSWRSLATAQIGAVP